MGVLSEVFLKLRIFVVIGLEQVVCEWQCYSQEHDYMRNQDGFTLVELLVDGHSDWIKADAMTSRMWRPK